MRTTKHTQKAAPEDWHRADIKAALEKKGWSLRRLSLANGYKDGNTLKNALARRWPKAEKIIADVIGVPPSEIWPSRYPDASENTTKPAAAATKKAA
ncbi:hypothetical protein BOW53_02845 [Solemya pervernicosa gill symbiont]|uniref:Ner winged helix-turn-helix DNA-binding domain-containing protein n=1 Tax=Solemya pervernicosa gill symbiont TaxID=642797 RepID=A0A1T2L9J0_9GAMM|nr:hypothetical protein BOW53_02845 [Solemya pervernicosa gill symbiont]